MSDLEARDRAIDDGIERLAAVVHDHPASVEARELRDAPIAIRNRLTLIVALLAVIALGVWWR